MSYMIRLCSKTHDSEKGLRIFNDMQLDGFVEHSKPYNSVLGACAAKIILSSCATANSSLFVI